MLNNNHFNFCNFSGMILYFIYLHNVHCAILRYLNFLFFMLIYRYYYMYNQMLNRGIFQNSVLVQVMCLLSATNVSISCLLQQGTKVFLDMSYSLLNRQIVTASADRHLRLWDPRTTGWS